MDLYKSSKDYLFNLHTASSSEAKRLWRKSIREQWNHRCAYCNSEEDLTIDHIVPQSKGGSDTTENVVCCCKSCNQSKSHDNWKDWYEQQEFFSEQRKTEIIKWMKSKDETRIVYPSRRNFALGG